MNMFNRSPLPPPSQQRPQHSREEKRKCKITKRKKRDGSTEISMEGCSPSEINALKEMGHFNDMEE